MISDDALQKILQAIRSEPELYGARIGLYADGRCRVVDPGLTPTLNYGRVMVILEESDGIGVKDVGPPPTEPTSAAHPQEFVSNRSRVGTELVGAGLSCGGAVLSGVGVLGGAAGEVPTGGLSTVLVVAAWTGFVTSGLQCANSLVRLGAFALDPDDNTLQRWDQNTLYGYASLVVDAIGIASAVASLPFAVKDLLAVLERRGGLVTAAQLDRMTRAERRQAIKEAIKRTSRTPEGRKAVEESMQRAGLTERQAKTAMKVGAPGWNRSKEVAAALSRETAARLNARIRDVLTGVAGPIISATPGALTGPASGSLNYLYVHFIEPRWDSFGAR